MKDPSSTRSELIKEISFLKKRLKELEQAELECRQTEDRYHTLIETANTGFVIVDRDGLVLDANPEYVRLTGHKDLSEIVGRSVIEWTADWEKEKNAAAIKAVLKKGFIRNLEIDHVDLKGNITPVEINATSIKIEGKIQTLTICRDISERRHTEEALQESRQRYESLIKSANEGIFVAQASMIRFVNPAFVRIIGHSKHDLVTKTFTEFIHPEDRDMVSENHIRRMRGEKFPSKYEFRVVTSEGATKNVEIDSVMIRWDGKPAVLGFINDITERKQAAQKIASFSKFPAENPNPVLRIAEDGTILYSNKGGLGLLAKWGVGIGEKVPEQWYRSIKDKFDSGKTWTEEEVVEGKIFSIMNVPLRQAGYVNLYAHDNTDRKRIEEKLQESERFALSTIDALTAHIAVLDENGTIIAVNKAWRDFAASNPPIHQNVCEMANYLTVCDVAKGEGKQQALAFTQGIRAVMAGEKKEFFLEYPCHSPSEKRWFVVRATRFSGSGPLRIVVAHENITERKLAEEELRLYREHLEELIKERTLELEEKNVELVKEITERNRAEKAIRESEERYRILVDLTPDIIYRIKEDKTIDFISSAIRQLGYNPEELIGTPFEEIVHPDDRQQVRDILLERRIGDRRTKNLEVRLLNKKQDPQDYSLAHTYIELSARAHWDVPDGEITRSDKHFLYTQGVAHDITMRKHAEEVLKENATRTRLLKNVAAAANKAATIDDVLKVAVEGIADFIGWPVGHVYITDDKKNETLIPTDIWYLEDENRFRLFREITAKMIFTPGVGMIGRVLVGKKTLWVEDVTVYPDFIRRGLSGDINVRGAFVFPVIVAGEVTAVLEFFSPKKEKPNLSLMDLMDEIGIHLGIVIERKKAEEELKKLSRAVEQSPSTVVITDIKGNIQYVNPKFSDLTGYSSAEAIGKNPRILNSGIQPKSYYKELWKTILSGREWYGTFCNRKKDGEIYWEKASISPVRNECGKISNFVAVKEDITKLLQYEEELKQAKQAAENANRAKSDFLASMSHELRTPLNAIIGFSEVLKEKYFGPLTEKQEEYAGDILESGKHLLSLINDILDLSKVEAGKMELELSQVNVSDLINNCLIMIREKSMKHNITLNKDVRQEVETLEIMADERKLKQVVFNLLSNAAKFTPDGGSIHLAAKLDHSSKLNADFLEISVEDNGIGIILEHQESIFEPFYQVKNSKQDKTPGTGLGLPLSKDLVELHGGTIWLESKGKGKGSKFSFRIPIERVDNL